MLSRTTTPRRQETEREGQTRCGTMRRAAKLIGPIDLYTYTIEPSKAASCENEQAQVRAILNEIYDLPLSLSRSPALALFKTRMHATERRGRRTRNHAQNGHKVCVRVCKLKRRLTRLPLLEACPHSAISFQIKFMGR